MPERARAKGDPMSLRTATIKIQGIAPLMFSSIESANILNPLAKEAREIMDKPANSRSDAENGRLLDLQWRLATYTDADGDVCLPSDNLDRMLVDAAPKVKKMLAARIKAGVFTVAPAKLKHGGGKFDKLAVDPAYRLVKLMSVSKTNKAKVLRCRPLFAQWSAIARQSFDDELIDSSMLERIWNTAGVQVGLCDSRPRCGRFTVESFTVV